MVCQWGGIELLGWNPHVVACGYLTWWLRSLTKGKQSHARLQEREKDRWSGVEALRFAHRSPENRGTPPPAPLAQAPPKALKMTLSPGGGDCARVVLAQKGGGGLHAVPGPHHVTSIPDLPCLPSRRWTASVRGYGKSMETPVPVSTPGICWGMPCCTCWNIPICGGEGGVQPANDSQGKTLLVPAPLPQRTQNAQLTGGGNPQTMHPTV